MQSQQQVVLRSVIPPCSVTASVYFTNASCQEASHRSTRHKLIFPDVVLENIGNSTVVMEHILLVLYFRKYYFSNKSHGAVGIVRK